jgi:UDP-N-acetylmuramate-alanine ligase
MQAAIEFILREARPGDAILTIGAGNVSRASGEFMVLLGTEYRVTDGIRDAD